ncbi:hypothetical protein ACFC1R_20565 [Kitasatospora sp. NPDC056138]|uniref:hypothetical protein n=1 Tax=Kitasatospora sp. NPDC056138 TaxID=3345724 RepID=UPI0035DFA583
MLSKRLVPAAVICGVLVAGTTACGGNKDKSAAAAPAAAASSAASAPPAAAPGPALDTGKLTADEIESRMKAVMIQAGSLTIDGTATVDGEKTAVHLAEDQKGNCTGTVEAGSSGSFELRKTASRTWIKPDVTFWKSMGGKQVSDQKVVDAVVQLLKGLWLTGGQDDQDLKGIADEMCGMAAGMAADDSKLKLTKGEAGTVDAVKTFSLDMTDEDGTTGKQYIATEGKPYLIRIANGPSDASNQFTFSDFGKPVTVEAPPADAVVDDSVFEQKLKSS